MGGRDIARQAGFDARSATPRIGVMVEPQQREIWYSGHVQGVGFRYTTLMVARRYAVTGFVQNVPDGRVHLVVEGERDELEGFLEAIRERMGSLIRDVRSVCRPGTGEYREFGVR